MSQTITPEVVRHIARLSRIELTKEQVAQFTPQLDDVLAHFNTLQQIDTENVEPMAHAVDLHNVLAGDEVGDSLSTEAALKNAPQREGDFFAVPKVLGEGA